MWWRERWAALTNEHLKEHGHEARVDHRSLEAQGIEREPTYHKGPAITAIERRSEQSQVLERRGWQERDHVSERLRVAKELGQLELEARRTEKTLLDLSADIAGARRARDQSQAAKLTPEQTREQAREAWLRLKTEREQATAKEMTPDKTQGKDATENLTPEQLTQVAPSIIRSRSR